MWEDQIEWSRYLNYKRERLRWMRSDYINAKRRIEELAIEIQECEAMTWPEWHQPDYGYW